MSDSFELVPKYNKFSRIFFCGHKRMSRYIFCIRWVNCISFQDSSDFVLSLLLDYEPVQNWCHLLVIFVGFFGRKSKALELKRLLIKKVNLENWLERIAIFTFPFFVMQQQMIYILHSRLKLSMFIFYLLLDIINRLEFGFMILA